MAIAKPEFTRHEALRAAGEVLRNMRTKATHLHASDRPHLAEPAFRALVAIDREFGAQQPLLDIDELVSARLHPREVASMPCPHCGKPSNPGDLVHSSSYELPGYGSTIYGVCAPCAEQHRAFGADMIKAISEEKAHAR